MSGLLTALENSGNTLRDIEKQVGITQSNVTNASTPGYVRQYLPLIAIPYSPETGMYGGVRTGTLENARNQYTELAVRHQFEMEGYYAEKTTTLKALESGFDITGRTSLSGAMKGLFDAFSAWSTTPNGGNERQGVIDKAATMATMFQQTSKDLKRSAAEMEQDARALVGSVNNLAARISDLNALIRRSGTVDAGVDAEMYATLEELSELVNFSAIENTDRTITILLGGQEALVVGDETYDISLVMVPSGNDAPPQVRINSAAGENITGTLTSGKLGGVLSVRNETIGGLLGDATRMGSLNELAYTMATRINEILLDGHISEPDLGPAVPGQVLFAVNNNANAAGTLALDGSITADTLAAIDPGPPKVANGIANRLAALGNPALDADKIAGMGYLDFYGSLAAGVGRELNANQTALVRQEQLVSQARSLRGELSGVSLDEEGAKLLEFQAAYQANSRMVTVINQLMDTLLNLIPQ